MLFERGRPSSITVRRGESQPPVIEMTIIQISRDSFSPDASRQKYYSDSIKY